MNHQENALATALIEEIKSCARIDPEKALKLSEAYRTLCAAYEIRRRAENPTDSDS